jgi:hypothetical protein
MMHVVEKGLKGTRKKHLFLSPYSLYTDNSSHFG